MTKQVERYYYFDDQSTVVWHTTDEENVPSYFEFLGSSMNPNIRMAVSVFVQRLPKDSGYKIKELP